MKPMKPESGVTSLQGIYVICVPNNPFSIFLLSVNTYLDEDS